MPDISSYSKRRLEIQETLTDQSIRGRLRARDAVEAGCPRTTLDRWVAEARLERPERAVIALPGAPQEKVDRVIDLQLSLRRESFACCWTALWLWGLRPTPPTNVWLMVRGQWAPARRRLKVVVCRNLPAEDVTVHRAVAVTTVARTLVDMAALADRSLLRGLLLDAVQRELTTYEEVRSVARRRRGAKGTGLIIRLCDDFERTGVESPLEDRTREWIATTHLPEPAPAGLVRTRQGLRQLDIPWPGRCVAFDCDGSAYHTSVAAHDGDAERLTDLATLDLCLAHVTWRKLDRHQDRLLAEAEALFERADRHLRAGVWVPLDLLPMP